MAVPLTIMTVLQVIVALMIVAAVYQLSLFLMKQDRLFIDARRRTPQFETKIIHGYADTSVVANKVFNTVNPAAKNYLHLPVSYNRKGGAQFSYSFWIFIDDVEAAANKTILLRGDNREYTSAVYFGRNAKTVGEYLKNPENGNGVKLTPPPSSMPANTLPSRKLQLPLKPDVMPSYPFIATPCITFGQRYDQLGVLFNTIQWPFNQVIINSVAHDNDNTQRRNALKLIAHKWALMTFVFEDNVSINDFEDGTVLRFYLNDILYYTERVPGALRLNNGNLYLFPNGGIPMTRIGDLTYYNYAVGQQRIKTTYEAGPPRYYYPDVSGRAAMGDPLYLSEYNKLDIYNS